MTNLPRSRALVRLDGPGHIMPVEPVTPPGSTAWRIVHFPVMLGVVAVGLLLIAVLAIQLLGWGFQAFAYIPGGRFLVPLIGAGAILAVYWVFTRLVERRPHIDELGLDGCATEIALGAGSGLGLSLATFGTLALLGALTIDGVNPPQVMLLPLVVQPCTAFVLEILLRGLAFRLAERLLGSWMALVLTALGFAALSLPGGTSWSIAAAILQGGLAGAAFYMVTRRLWGAIGLDAAWNIGQIALYGVATSTSGPHGLLLTRVAGPEWMTGGMAGAGASGPALALSALLVAALLLAAIRRGRIVRPAWRRGRTRGDA